MSKLKPEVADKYTLVGKVGDSCQVAGIGQVRIADMSLKVADHLFASGIKFLKKRPVRKKKEKE